MNKMVSIRSVTTISLQLLKDCVNRLPLEQWLPKRKSRLGRKGYSARSLFLAYLLKIRENIPYDTVLARKLRENETYRKFCGFKRNTIPSHDTVSRFIKQLTPRRLQTIFLRIDALLTENHAFALDELALDATDTLSNPRNKHHPDPEAGYGHKTDGERFHGYWAVFVAGSKTELLRAMEVVPANVHQSMPAQKLFGQLAHQDLCGATILVADSAYDDKKTYARAIELGLVPLIAYNPKHAKIKTFTKLKPSNWRKRCLGSEGFLLRQKYYTKRGAVERYQSTFKNILNGRAVPVRGLYKVTCYLLGLSILSQLYGLINWGLQRHSIQGVQRTLWDYLN